MILEELEAFVESLEGSSEADFTRNSENYCKIMTKLVNPRYLKSLSDSELTGIHAALCWLSINSLNFEDVVDAELLDGSFEFDDDGNSLFVVLDSLLSQEDFPTVILEHLINNPEMLYCGFNAPDWITTKPLSEKLFLRLWTSLEEPFRKGYREQMIRNPHLPESLKGLNWWED